MVHDSYRAMASSLGREICITKKIRVVASMKYSLLDILHSTSALSYMTMKKFLYPLWNLAVLHYPQLDQIMSADSERYVVTLDIAN